MAGHAGAPREDSPPPGRAGFTVRIERPGAGGRLRPWLYRNPPVEDRAVLVRYGYAGEEINVEHFFAFDGDPKTDFLRTLALRLPLKVAERHRDSSVPGTGTSMCPGRHRGPL
jgi:hypothetical protein